MYMKVRIEDIDYAGTGTEIMDRLRSSVFDALDFPDTDSYIWFLQSNYTRVTDLDCVLPEGDTEQRARAMFSKLEEIGALTLLEDG